MEDSQGCDIVFQLNYKIGDGPVVVLGEWREVYDGDVTVIKMDLSSLVGQEVQFILSAALNNNKPESANGFWFVPSLRIVQPTSTPTPTPTP